MATLGDTSYVTMGSKSQSASLTPAEISRLKEILLRNGDGASVAMSLDSDYPEFTESTHAWAIFADDPKKRAGFWDRVVGTMIIVFQLFTYWMFAQEAIEDYGKGQVAVMVAHNDCIQSGEQPQQNFACEAEVTNNLDALIAFFMLGIFLSGDFLQSFRAIKKAPTSNSMIFALLAGVEIVSAFVAASIAVSYNLFIGEVTDAVEVGVGLLFIRELSQKAYAGIRDGETKQYRHFLIVLFILVVFGMFMDPICEAMFTAADE